MGDSSLEAVAIDGDAGRIYARALLVFIGADPCSAFARRLAS